MLLFFLLAPKVFVLGEVVAGNFDRRGRAAEHFCCVVGGGGVGEERGRRREGS